MVNFGEAIVALKDGHRVARSGWNGKGMWLFLIKGEAVRQAISDRYGDEGDGFPVCDAIYMKTADNKLVPWLASQADILAEDWEILND